MKRNAAGFAWKAAGLGLLVLLILGLLIPMCASADVQDPVVRAENLTLTNVTCEFEEGSDGMNENSVGSLGIIGEATGPSTLAEVRIASWFDHLPTAEEALDSVKLNLSVWRENETSVDEVPELPFMCGGGRPVRTKELGKKTYTILAGMDKNMELVGYAVIETEIPVISGLPAEEEEEETEGYTGLGQGEDGVWRYYSNGYFLSVTGVIESMGEYYYVIDGVLAVDANGLVPVDRYWFLLSDGQVLNAYNGLYGDANLGWWLIQGGVINFDYTGLYCDRNYGWWLIQGGAVNFGYTGLYGDATYGWWLVGNGAVCFDYNGVWNDQNLGSWVISNGQPVAPANQTPAMADGLHDDGNGWHLYLNGEVAAWYTGLYCDANVGWWLVTDGAVNFGYTGLYCDANYGWWLIGGGSVCFDYTGLWCDPQFGWWLIGNGSVCFDYTGFWDDPNFGCWLIRGGTIAWDYTDDYYNDPNFGSYYVINGQMIEGGNG